jgi:two-component system, NtrC family, sensor kinase
VPLREGGAVIGIINLIRQEVRPFSETQIELVQAFAAHAQIAMKNARLIDETREALEQQKASADVLSVIGKSVSDAAPVFEAILDACQRLFGSEQIGVYVIDDDTVRVAAWRGPRAEEIRRDVTPLAESITSQAIRERRVHHIPDTREIPSLSKTRRANVARFGGESLLYAPMLWEDRGLGSILVARSPPRPFSDREQALLQSFADQAAIAIENARLFNETKEALRQQTATSDILRVIASSPGDMQPVLDRLAETTCRLCEASDALILLREGDYLRFSAHYGPIPVPANFLGRPISRHWPPGRAVADRKTVHVPDLAAAEDEYPVAVSFSKEASRAATPGLAWRTALATPLMREAEAIGVIALRRAEVWPFTEAQIALLQTFADQAVIAIQNARLFDEVQARTRDLEEALEQQKATSEVLQVISRSTFDLGAVFRTLVENAVRLCGARTGMIFQRDGELMRLAAADGATPEFVRHVHDNPIAPGPISMTGRAALEGRTFHVLDIENDPEYAYSGRSLERYRSIVAVPLMRDRTPIGVFTLWRHQVEAFTPRQIALVETFADQAVVAIENVRLFNETQDALERQTATADILKVIASSPTDVQPVFEAIATSANRLLGGFSTAVFRIFGDEVRLAAFTPVDRAADRALVAFFPRPLPEFPGFELIRGGEFAQIADTESENSIRELARARGYRSMLFTPLLSNGAPIGIISVTRKEPSAFAAHHIQLLKTFADQAVIAIENVRLFDEVQTRTRDLEESLEQQTATADVLKAISRTAFDLDTVLQTLISTAVRLCDASGGEIFRRHGDVFRYAASLMDLGPAYLEHEQKAEIRAGRGTLIGRVAAEKRTIEIADAWNDPEYAEKEEARVGGVRAMLGVPLMRDGELIGAFALGRPAPIPFTKRQVDLVTTFADQAVIAIENVRLFDEVQAKTRDLEEALQQQTATANVLKVISRSAFDLQAVFDTLIASAVELVGAFNGAICLREGDSFVYRAKSGIQSDFDKYLAEHPPTPGRGSAAGRVILSRQVESIPDVLEDPDYVVPAYGLNQTRSVLGVPLLRDDRIEGALVLARVEPGPFSQREVEIVQTFADQAVIAIENVRLLDEVQARTRDLEESLQQQTATADVLKVISRSTHDLQPVLDTLVRTVAHLCDAEMAFILRRDGDLYRAGASVGLSEEYAEFLQSHPISVDRGAVTGRAVLERRTVQIADVTTDPEYMLTEASTLTGQRTALGVPLTRSGEVIGVFVLARRRVEPFTQRQIELVTTFADQAVIAINNVNMFHETQEALKQQTATADVLKVISRSAFDLDVVFDALLNSAVSLLGSRGGTICVRDGDVFPYRAVAEGRGSAMWGYLSSHPARPGRASVAGRVLLSGKPEIIADTLLDGDFKVPVQSLAGSRSVAGVPLLRDDKVEGALMVGRAEAGPFDSQEIELLQTFADQAVIAIENARLFEQVQARTRDLEEALAQQTATANVLKVISRSAFDLQAVLMTLAESARELCGASFVTLFMRDGDEMRLRAESGCTPGIVDFLHAHPIRAGRETFTGRVMMSGEAVHLPDVLADAEYNFGEAPRIGNYRAVLGVPLLREGRVEGIFGLARPSRLRSRGGKSKWCARSRTRRSSPSRMPACSKRCRRARKSSPPRSTTCARRRIASSSRRNSLPSASSPPASPTRSRTRSILSTISRRCRASWSANWPR